MWCLMLLALGCDDQARLQVGDDSASTLQDTNDTGEPSADERPIIESGTIWCTAGSNSSGDIFYVELDADDPQGADTLEPGGLVAGWDATGALVFEDAILVCSSSGRCTATFRDEIYSGVSCSNHSLYTYTAQVVDEDDNLSERHQLVWVD